MYMIYCMMCMIPNLVAAFSHILQNPKDTSYVFSGYAPLSIRLIEMLEKPNGFAKMEEVRMTPLLSSPLLPLSLSLTLSLFLTLSLSLSLSYTRTLYMCVFMYTCTYT